MSITVKGKIEKKLFPKGNAPSDFKIYALVPDDQTGLDVNKYNNITIKGNLPDLITNYSYEFELEYESKNGRTGYNVVKILSQMNATVGDDAFAYLCQITTPNRASEILKAYPDIIDKVKNGDNIDTSKIKGVGDKTMKKLASRIEEQFVYYDIITEFKEYDLTMSQIRKLSDHFGSADIIRAQMNRNAYNALVSVAGIGFKIADEKILNKLPHFRTSNYRLTEAILYILSQNETSGHTYMLRDDLYSKCKEIVPECMEMFALALEKSERIYIDKEKLKVAKSKTFECESRVAELLLKINSKTFPKKADGTVFWKPKWKDKHENKIDSSSIDEKYKYVDGFELTENQQKTIPMLIDNNVVILTGVAGAGKSASCQAVIKWLEDNHKTYMLLAPTGRAAAVLNGYTNRPTSTIHRALINGSWKEKTPLVADVIIIDEATMIDVFLMKDLLEAVPDYAKVLFVCDFAQIGSVSAGNCIQDMLRSKKFATVVLDKVFRYGEGGLSYVATETRKGNNYLSAEPIQVFGKKEDYIFEESEDESVVHNAVKKYVQLYKEGVDINDMVVVSCYNKGKQGTVEINNMIQRIINPAKEKNDGLVGYTKDKTDVMFNVGDRVMQTKNNYHVKKINGEDDEECVLYNGDFGVIKYITDEKSLICVFGEHEVEVPKMEVSDLVLGYSVSCHKMQGDNRKYVILITPSSHTFFLNRNLLYVALTRSKYKLYHYGNRETINKCLKKSENLSRKTFLEQLLKNCENN